MITSYRCRLGPSARGCVLTAENIRRLASELKVFYTGAAVAEDGGRTWVKLPKVHFPSGRNPETTSALVELDPGQPQPQFFLRDVPALPTGQRPNVSPVTLAGESWFTYSFNLRWDENQHTAVQFVEGKLRRFALDA